VKHFTCEHGNLIDIVEFTEVFAVEAGPEIGNQDLSTLVETYSLSVEDCLIAETGEVFC
jgi:hypothetical protein